MCGPTVLPCASEKPIMDREQFNPQRQPPKKNNEIKDFVTLFAMSGLALLGVVLFGLFGMVTSGVMLIGVGGVLVFIAGLAVFHFCTWGWMMSRFQDSDEKFERWW